MNTTIATIATADRSITIPTSVPSGYARQAQLEASLSNGFKAYDAQVAR